MAYCETVKLVGNYKIEIALKSSKEIRERGVFGEGVGLDYLTLTRSAETLSGVKPSASPCQSNWGRLDGRDVCT